jgi:2-keto-4-pentenoate hydratase/2-oxohepta-3-ene-1,7-dioic acid hydratase in catechol pathway
MRLMQFVSGGEVRLGAVIDNSVVDVAAARREMSLRKGFRGARLAGVVDRLAPLDIADLLALGDVGRANVQATLDWVGSADEAQQAHLGQIGVVTDLAAVQYAVPMSPSSAIYCVGFNYAAHVAEAGAKIPSHPELFMRTHNSVAGHLQPIVRPPVSDMLDWEAELAIVIGRPCHRVSPEQAADYIAGYTCFNDGSLRDYQKHTAFPTPGKNFAASGAMGPWLVTADEVPEPQALRITTTIGDEVVQSANTDDMIFKIGEMVSYISDFAYLQPGDVIATGTPSGVGFRRSPQRFLKPGEVLTIEFEGVGSLQNTIVDEIDLPA